LIEMLFVLVNLQVLLSGLALLYEIK